MNPYLIGLIAADGHNTGSYWVITMVESDRELLDRIASSVSDTSMHIQHRKEGDGSYGKQPMCHLRRFSEKDCALLAEWGVPVGNKYHTLSFPDSSDEHVWQYLCGYFDGDGTICAEGEDEKNPRVELISNQEWCRHCRDFLSRFGIKSFIHIDRRCEDVASVVIRRRNHVYSFMERIYRHSDLRLSRKEEKWLRLSKKNARIRERVFITAKQKKEIEQELINGVSVAKLHSRFGLCKNSITRIKRELLGSRKERNKCLAERVRNLFQAGLSITEVCRRAPCSYYMAKKVQNELE